MKRFLLVIFLIITSLIFSVKISVLCSPDNADALKWLAQEFMKQNPEIQVEIVPLSWEVLYPKLLQDLRSQAGSFDAFTYDVMTTGAVSFGLVDLGEFMKQHPELVPEDYDLNDFIPQVLEESGKWQGKLVGLPFYNNTMLFYYRKDLFEDPKIKQAFKEKYGRELTLPTTWEEVVEIAEFFTKKYNKSSPTDYGIALMFPRTHTLFYMYLLFFGEYRNAPLGIMRHGTADLEFGEYFTADHKPAFNSEEGLKALEMMKKLMPYSPDPLGSDYGETIEYFNQGLVAMVPQWTGPYLIFKSTLGEDKVGIIPMPGRSVSGQWALGINKFIPEDKKLAAFKFIIFATSKWADKNKFLRFAVAPARISTLQDPEVRAADPRVPALEVTYVSQTHRPRIPEEPRLEDITVEIFSKILSGELPLSMETLNDLAKKWEEILGK
ncbi:MAG: Extracellular solute-binding protein family 1 [Thermotoga petrophila]|jgi:ABC-type glycerol-3-phosphate transport system substrate-binding protein|uniref:Extracellular solute-binding protein family 1 n=1 Tax=Thermotoga petrophila TaxID=93929 RepID=A0A101ENX5_9THEM|nr:MAG: Extracellular solute-binding protein family 1 [Thermotoga petrophila]